MSHDHDRHGPGREHDHGGHEHAHGAGHVHAPASFGKAFAIGVGLNAGFVIVEVAYGIIGGSVALLADAGHNLGDVLGLMVAWVASVLVRRAPSARFTYGLRGSSILAALFNAIFLLVTIGGISWEAILRLGHAEPVSGKTVMIVAAIGIAVNGVTAWLFAAGRKGVASLHDLHIWSMSTTEIALTSHLVMPDGHPGDAFIHDLCEELASRFEINHATVQIEVDPHLTCALASDDVV